MPPLMAVQLTSNDAFRSFPPPPCFFYFVLVSGFCRPSHLSLPFSSLLSVTHLYLFCSPLVRSDKRKGRQRVFDLCNKFISLPILLPMSDHLKLRLVALAASVFVAIAAGTPYLYGVYGPQLMQRCGFNTLDSATVSLCMNIGCGLAGFPGGLVIDALGPLWGIVLGSVFIFAGYFGTFTLYTARTSNLFLLCLFMCLVGLGSTTCFFSTLKATQLNFPKYRGSAGALPVSSYGLSATIFSFIAATYYSNSSGPFIQFLAIFCGSVTFVGSWFIHVYDDSDEGEFAVSELSSIATTQSQEEVLLLSRQASSASLSQMAAQAKPSGREVPESAIPPPQAPQKRSRLDSLRGSLSFWGIGERSARPSVSFASLGVTPKSSLSQVVWAFLTNKTFLLHYIIVSVISGSCQMYIYTVGFIVIAQTHYRENEENKEPLESLNRSVFKRGPSAPRDPKSAEMQAIQVSIISLASFLGRLCSGLLSDYIYKKHHLQRLWIIAATLLTLALGEYLVMTNTHIGLISLTSILMGGSYGLVFGTYPAVIADKFGAKTFTTLWGLICTGPLISLFVLNKYFGVIYDLNTDSKTGICYKGNECYRGAFEVSMALAFCVFFLTLYVIRILRKPRLEVGV